MKNEEIEEIKEKVLSEYKKGNIVVYNFEGIQSMPLDKFLEQPIEGILYDVNRDDATILTFIQDKKWINDFALTKLLMHQSKQIDELKEENKRLEKYSYSQEQRAEKSESEQDRIRRIFLEQVDETDKENQSLKKQLKHYEEINMNRLINKYADTGNGLTINSSIKEVVEYIKQ